MADFLSCSGTVQALLNLYNKGFAQEAAGHKKALVALKNKVATSTADANTAATNTVDMLGQKKQGALNKFDQSFNQYSLSLKNAIKLASNAKFDQDQESAYTKLPSSQEIEDHSKALKSMFEALYTNGANFVAHDLAEELNNPYAVNTEVSYDAPIATPASKNSCFAVKTGVKAELEGQKNQMKQDFATDLRDAQTDATNFFKHINNTMIPNAKGKVVLDEKACVTSLKDLTTKMVDHFASAIADSKLYGVDNFLSASEVQPIVRSFKQSTCGALATEVVGDVKAGLDAVASGVQFDA